MIDVDVEDVEYLRSFGFTWTRIADILQISRSTLYRRLEEEGISSEARFSNISDVDEIRDVKMNHPNDGERMVIGHLRQKNICVPRSRARASIHRVDPINTQLRRSVTVRRRTYYSEGPNTVWHIDGHHKLIRWRLVTHGAIDGYSRTIVFLKCSPNNKATTVLQSFIEAAEEHGLPNKIRTDLGGENVEVWRYMVEQHSSSSAVITGSSTHNERIERLWRDVHRCVSVLFADTFRGMQESNILDCLNEVDMFCLHFTFIPRINTCLQSFVESWNNHCISTERNLTPNQLFIQGCIRQGMMPQPPSQLGPNNVPFTRATSNHVRVPTSRFTPCTPLCRLLSTINSERISPNFGVDIYNEVVSVVGQHIVNGCTNCSC